MKVIVKATSQEEFDAKRVELIKSIAGSKLEVDIRVKGESKMNDEREPYYDSQKHILEDWNSSFRAMIGDIKRDIAGVLGE